MPESRWQVGEENLTGAFQKCSGISKGSISASTRYSDTACQFHVHGRKVPYQYQYQSKLTLLKLIEIYAFDPINTDY